jgi:hypothetical protein
VGQRCIKQGDLLREELVAIELEIRREILDFIGFELRWMKEIGEELGLNGEELDHLSLLERALLIDLLNYRSFIGSCTIQAGKY